MSKSPGIARTNRLDLAAFLVGGRRLKFLRCEPVNGNGRLDFLFEGEQSDLDKLELGFDSGAEVSGIGLLEALKRLRRVMRNTSIEYRGHEYAPTHNS